MFFSFVLHFRWMPYQNLKMPKNGVSENRVTVVLGAQWGDEGKGKVRQAQNKGGSGQTLGRLLHQSPKFYTRQLFLFRWLNNFEDFYFFIYWLLKLSVQTFQPLIVIYRRVYFGYHYWGCTLYINLSAIVLSLQIPAQNKDDNIYKQRSTNTDLLTGGRTDKLDYRVALFCIGRVGFN